MTQTDKQRQSLTEAQEAFIEMLFNPTDEIVARFQEWLRKRRKRQARSKRRNRRLG